MRLPERDHSGFTHRKNGREGNDYPSKPILLREFLEILRLGYACRRPEENIIDRLDTCGIASGDTLTRAQAAYICSQVKV